MKTLALDENSRVPAACITYEERGLEIISK
jgi:hypothetical protein